MKAQTFIVAGALFTLGFLHARAEESTVKDDLIEKNRQIAEYIDELAKKLDAYVANANSSEATNKTTVTVRNSFNFSEEGERRYSPSVGVKLHLPSLEKKLRLTFTSFDEDEEERGINKNRFKTSERAESYGTSVALIEQLGKVKATFRPRVDMREKLRTSYLLSFDSDGKLGALELKPELQLFARSDTGTGQFVAMNIRYEFNADHEGLLINEEQYTDGDNTMTTNNGLRWAYQLNDQTAFRQALFFESSNRHKYHLERTVFSSSVHHKVYKDILHYNLTPYVMFPRDQDFRHVFGLDANLEFIF